MNVTTAAADGRQSQRRLFGFLLAPALVLGLAACDTNDGGMSDEDAAAIRDQIEQVADRLDAVEQRLMDLSSAEDESEPAVLISEVREVRDDVGEARNMLTEVSQQLADEEAEENLETQDAVDPADDPLAPAPGNDPLVPGGDLDNELNDDMNIGDDLNDLGNDVQEGAQDAGQSIREGAEDAGDAIQDGVNDLSNGADDTLDDDPMNDDAGADDLNDDVNDPAPLEDPLVPNAPDL